MGRFQGLRVNETAQWGEDYRKESVEEVYRHEDRWKDWEDVTRWLDSNGEADDALNPGEVASMKEDFSELSRQRMPFTNDPGRAFELAHANRLRPKTPFKSGRGTGGSQV